jgi:putative sterol carrier protein
MTPTVTDLKPVIEALKANNVVVLKNHGVLAMGKNLFDCFLLIQCLEESVKTDAISRIYAGQVSEGVFSAAKKDVCIGGAKKYKLFSKEQIDEIVRLVNSDEQLKKLGESTNMTMQLAVKLDETAQVYCFEFEKGHIKNTSNNENAEFVVSAPEKIWRAVFAREIDPFVATTQKKMILKGDFGKISKWYAPCSRLFELWSQVSVE